MAVCPTTTPSSPPLDCPAVVIVSTSSFNGRMAPKPMCQEDTRDGAAEPRISGVAAVSLAQHRTCHHYTAHALSLCDSWKPPLFPPKVGKIRSAAGQFFAILM